MQGRAVPTRVTASAATGIATSEPFNCVPQTEDTITLLVDWQSLSSSKHKGTAVYTASWTAPLKSGVHTSQHWYYMAEKVRHTLSHTSRHDFPSCVWRIWLLGHSGHSTALLRYAHYCDHGCRLTLIVHIRRAKSTSTRPTEATTSSTMRRARLGTTHSSAWSFTCR